MGFLLGVCCVAAACTGQAGGQGQKNHWFDLKPLERLTKDPQRFLLKFLKCANCKGDLWLTALIKTAATSKKILAAMGLPTLPPAAAPARAPPCINFHRLQAFFVRELHRRDLAYASATAHT